MLVEELGRRLGENAVLVAEKIKCRDFTEAVHTRKSIVKCPGKKMVNDLRSLSRVNNLISFPKETKFLKSWCLVTLRWLESGQNYAVLRRNK